MFIIDIISLSMDGLLTPFRLIVEAEPARLPRLTPSFPHSRRFAPSFDAARLSTSPIVSFV